MSDTATYLTAEEASATLDMVNELVEALPQKTAMRILDKYNPNPFEEGPLNVLTKAHYEHAVATLTAKED